MGIETEGTVYATQRVRELETSMRIVVSSLEDQKIFLGRLLIVTERLLERVELIEEQVGLTEPKS